MTDQATRDADRELDLALEEEQRRNDAAERAFPPVETERGRLVDNGDGAFMNLMTALDQQKDKAAAEERAKRRMESRQAFTQRLKQRWRVFVVAMQTLIVLLTFAGLAWAGNNWQQIVPAWNKNATATKNCIFKVGSQTVTGTRTSIYRYYQILDWQFHDEKTVETETRIDVSGNGMSVLQYIDGKPDKLVISDGEKYRQLLKVADHYAIFMDNGKNAADISFADMCK